MPKLLFRAKDRDGTPRAGRIEARTAEEAVAKLKAAGYTEIQLHTTVSTSALSPDHHAGLSELQSARLAAFELEARERPLSIIRLMKQVARQSLMWIVFDLAFLVLGVVLHNPRWVALAAFLLVLTFGLPIWRLRHAKRYDLLLRAWAVGDWARVEALIARLRGSRDSENFQFDLAIRSASIRARRGDLPGAIAELEPWRVALANKAPVLFHGRIASVYAAGRDYAAFCAHMEQALELSKDEPDRLVDAGLAAARFGDIGHAQELLDKVNLEALPVHGPAFVQWARGVIALRSNDAAAQAHLAQAMSGFLERAGTPAVWTALACCGGAYALALARDGKAEEARSVVARVALMLQAHGDTGLLEQLDAALGLEWRQAT